MKITDKEKGINHNLFGWSDDDLNNYYDDLATQELPPLTDTDDVLEMIKRNEQAQIEWEKQGELNIKTLLAKQKPLVESFKKKQAIATSKKQKIAYDGDSFIGDRIEFLMGRNNQEIAEFCRNIGMSRSSLHRYIKGSHLPSEKSLRKIIEGLYVSVADFCYEPEDFDKWKSAFEKSAESNDIFLFKEKMLEQLRINNFTYKNNGIIMRLPNRYFELFRNLVKDSFEVLDLIPHDKQK